MRTYKSKKYICIVYLYNFFDQNIVLLHLYKITKITAVTVKTTYLKGLLVVYSVKKVVS